ncbi:MFS transporter [Edaphobacter bradus]|uniref:MFS transporter n=1 Tax=Edaphobacter bradus TaxID=2259016 RepID=UPI0021DF9A11|nr:MFS transporter [Edaphobacter bradus]
MNCGRLPCDDAQVLSKPLRTTVVSNGAWVLAATVLGSSMEFIDGTVVNVALPSLQTGLGASGTQAQWVVEAYGLFLSALLLVGGSLGDRLGVRRVFVAGVVLFAAASVWCGSASDIGQLIAARSLQGVGGALLVPNSLALLSASFPPDGRGRAIGTWSGFASMMTAVGPVVGGWLTQHGSWRWVFFINVPLALVAVWIVMKRVPEIAVRSPLRGLRDLDWTGVTLATGGLSGVTYALIEGSHGGHWVWLAGIVGVMLLAAFLSAEQRSSSPMMPLELFRCRSFLGANLLTFFLYAAFGGALYYLPLNLIQAQGYSPTAAGASLLPLILLMFLLSRWAGGLISRHGARLPLITGPLIAAVGFVLLARPSVGGSYWTTYFPGVLVLGLGMTVSVAPLTTVVMSSVDESRTGVASGVNNAVSQVAALLALAVLAPVFFHVFAPSLSHGLERAGASVEVVQQVESQRIKLGAIKTSDSSGRAAVEEAFVASFRVVVWVAGGLAAAASASAALTLSKGCEKRQA